MACADSEQPIERGRGDGLSGGVPTLEDEREFGWAKQVELPDLRGRPPHGVDEQTLVMLQEVRDARRIEETGCVLRRHHRTGGALRHE